MNAPLNILAALASCGVKAVIENGHVRLVCPKDNPPPAELIEAARARKEELRTLLTDDERARQDAFEVRLTGDTQGGAEDDSDLHDGDDVLLRRGTYSQALAALHAERPAYVDAADWQQAIEDAHGFVTQWGKQAVALGWAPADLFGLHTPPEKPAPNYRRLSRYDQTGLIWLLHGRRVVALTKNTAVIQTANCTVSYDRLLRSAGGAQR
jgi:hypothetical protein